MKQYVLLFACSLFHFHCKPEPEEPLPEFPGKPAVPASIKKEHNDLLMQLQHVALIDDSTEIASKKLSDLIRHHFTEEENYVLPQLGLLPQLAAGKAPAERKQLIQLSERLKTSLPHLSAEHQLIAAYLDELKQVAKKEDLKKIIEFEKALQHHKTLEEEVLFPAAILIGEYLQVTSK